MFDRAFRERLIGTVLVIGALIGVLPVLLRVIGAGADLTPGASSFMERRFGNIGEGMVVLWLAFLGFVVFIAWIEFRSARQHRRER